MKSFIIAFALIAVASAQVVRFSKCPNYSLQKNFDPDRVSIYVVPNTIQQWMLLQLSMIELCSMYLVCSISEEGFMNKRDFGQYFKLGPNVFMLTTS